MTSRRYSSWVGETNEETARVAASARPKAAPPRTATAAGAVLLEDL